MNNNFHLFFFLFLLGNSCQDTSTALNIQCVEGSIQSDQLGKTLIHEHVLVDFIGAESTGYHRWNRAEVVKKVLPYLREIKDLGFESLVECTPTYLGRDPKLLKMLSEQSGLNILTNTGYYGARNNQFIPKRIFPESAWQLAGRWIKEWEQGIEGTGIKPGFIKISVDPDSILSIMHRKLIRAAAITHRATGLTIASHTQNALPAFQQLAILKDEDVAADAFIWVHAQAEKDPSQHIKAAREGAWISLDNVNRKEIERYVQMIKNLKDQDLLHRVLISHDAGWYTPGEKNGGDFRPYTDLSEYLIPALIKAGFNVEDIDQLLIHNPAEAFAIRKRLLE